MKKRYMLCSLLLCLIPGGTFLTQKISQHTSTCMTDFDKITFQWMGAFAHVLHLIKEKHYKASNLENAWIKAIDAFLNQLDAHSAIMDEHL